MKLKGLQHKLVEYKLKKISKEILKETEHDTLKKETEYFLIKNIFDHIYSIKILFDKKEYSSSYVLMRSVLEKSLILNKLSAYTEEEYLKADKYTLPKELKQYMQRVNKLMGGPVFIDIKDIPNIKEYYDNLTTEEKRVFELGIFMNMEEEYNKSRVIMYSMFFGFRTLIQDIAEKNKKEIRDYYNVASQFVHPHYRSLMYLKAEKYGLNGQKKLRRNLMNEYLPIYMLSLMIMSKNKIIPQKSRIKINSIYDKYFAIGQ